MGRKGYSAEEQANALVVLAAEGGDYKKAADKTGISAMTIHRWANKTTGVDASVPMLVEDVLQHLLSNIPEKMSGHDWAVTVGILLDKWILLNGGATVRTENIINEKKVEDLTDNEFFDELKRADEAIARLAEGKTITGVVT